MHILEVVGPASGVLVKSGGIPILCEKVHNMESIDIAENSIKSLEFVSYEYGDLLVEQGLLPVLLNIADFFIANTQVNFLFFLK